MALKVAYRLADPDWSQVQARLDPGTNLYGRPYMLERLAVDRLKIDRSLVRDVVDNCDAARRAGEIVALGHALGMQVVAEGVETPAQQHSLLDLGCDGFQGYVFSQPLARGQFLAYVDAMQSRHARVIG